MMARLGFSTIVLDGGGFCLGVYRECDRQMLLALLYPSRADCEAALGRAAIPAAACAGAYVVLGVDVDCWGTFMLEHLEATQREVVAEAIGL